MTSAAEKNSEYLHKLMRALYDPAEGTRKNAANAIFNWLTQNNIHPDDFSIAFGGSLVRRQMDQITRLDARMEELGRENRFLREHVKAPTLRAAERAGKIAYHWPEFEQLICDHVFDGKLPRDWQTEFCTASLIPKSLMRKWQKGLARIPDDILDRLRAMAKPPEPAKPPMRAAIAAAKKPERKPRARQKQSAMF